MFHENYAFFSGTSRYMALHFKAFADHVTADYLAVENPFVVEMGSNDGIMLQNFAAAGIRRPWKLRSEFLSPRYTTCWDELLTVTDGPRTQGRR